MGKTVASHEEPVDPAKVIGRASECTRRLLEAGLPYEALQLPITNPQARESIVRHWRSLYDGGELKTAGLPAEEIIQKFSDQISIFRPREVAKNWRSKPPKNTLIRYTEETIQECVAENAKGEDWRLVFYLGLSARQMHQIIGTDQNHQPCFYKDNTWWLKKKEDPWAKARLRPNFYLVNFKPKFAGLSWFRQEEEIKRLGPKFRRCLSNVFRQGAMDAFFLNNNERISGGNDWWYHWGEEGDSGGRRVGSGRFDGGGFDLDADPPGNSSGALRAVLAREFDFN